MTIRRLAAAEFSRLAEHPLLEGIGLPDPRHSVIVVAEEGAEIVAFWVTVEVLHIEPVWISPKYRGGGLVRRLWRAVKSVVDDCGAKEAFCFSDRPETADYLARLGLSEKPWRLFHFARKDS